MLLVNEYAFKWMKENMWYLNQHINYKYFYKWLYDNKKKQLYVPNIYTIIVHAFVDKHFNSNYAV